MHTTSRGRVALLACLACVGAIALAKRGERHWAARVTAQGELAVPSRGNAQDDSSVPSGALRRIAQDEHPEGDRLRDGKPLDLNRATESELALLPGVGPKIARAIVEARTRNGRFTSVEQLDAVRGLGAKKLARLRRFVRIDAP